MSVPGPVRIAAVALLGLVAAAALAFAASRLAAQHIGLASEPLSAGDRLAPSASRARPARPARPVHRTRRRAPTPTATAVAPAVAPAVSTPAPPAPVGAPSPGASPPVQSSPRSTPSEAGDRGDASGSDD